MTVVTKHLTLAGCKAWVVVEGKEAVVHNVTAVNDTSMSGLIVADQRTDCEVFCSIDGKADTAHSDSEHVSVTGVHLLINNKLIEPQVMHQQYAPEWLQRRMPLKLEEAAKSTFNYEFTIGDDSDSDSDSDADSNKVAPVHACPLAEGKIVLQVYHYLQDRDEYIDWLNWEVKGARKSVPYPGLGMIRARLNDLIRGVPDDEPYAVFEFHYVPDPAADAKEIQELEARLKVLRARIGLVQTEHDSGGAEEQDVKPKLEESEGMDFKLEAEQVQHQVKIEWECPGEIERRERKRLRSSAPSVSPKPEAEV